MSRKVRRTRNIAGGTGQHRECQSAEQEQRSCKTLSRHSEGGQTVNTRPVLAVRTSLMCQEGSRAVVLGSISDLLCDLGQVT